MRNSPLTQMQIPVAGISLLASAHVTNRNHLAALIPQHRHDSEVGSTTTYTTWKSQSCPGGPASGLMPATAAAS